MLASRGLRERKKRSTRQALASAALRLALERGPGGVTVDEISAEAGVSPRTFFNYFGSKEDAILNVDPDRATQLRAALEARPAHEPPLDALEHVLLDASSMLEADAEAWAMRQKVARDDPSLFHRYVATFTDLERQLVGAIAHRCGADPERDLYPWILVSTTLTATRMATTRWLASERRRPLRDNVGEAFAVLRGGMQAPARGRSRRSRLRAVPTASLDAGEAGR